MSRTNFTESDEGKRVVNADGDTVGMVSGVKSGTAYIDPEPGITDKIRSKLGWDNVDQDDYPLDDSRVETITDDEIRLERGL